MVEVCSKCSRYTHVHISYVFRTFILEICYQEWHVNSDDDDEGEEGFIPLEEVQAFRKQQQHYNEQRRQLRNDLRLKFDQLCGRVQNQSQ